ncbi:redoxin domain-containing protein [Pontibacter sp. SGAir0037]|uniref:redoxin domain-containing protein n=1 Tax=Pontibacter sp. SGAir0037 TaxID=2571030 RepID=UPI00143CFBDC|nr:redoxin domain-containing protein [Pontibacter sp. SGAir0037]
MLKGFAIGALGTLAVAFAIIFFLRSQRAEKEVEKSVPAMLQNDLPWLPLMKPDSTRIVAKDIKGKAVIVLFQPDCDHCQREAAEISEHLEAFKSYNLFFVSDAPLSQIKQFSEEYKLAGNDKVHFMHTATAFILETYGPVPSPSLYIYSDKGNLVKEFKGETPVKEIIQAL